jgi:hypothetical protein
MGVPFVRHVSDQAQIKGRPLCAAGSIPANVRAIAERGLYRIDHPARNTLPADLA